MLAGAASGGEDVTGVILVSGGDVVVDGVGVDESDGEAMRSKPLYSFSSNLSYSIQII